MPHYTRQTVWTSDKKYCIPAGTHIFPNLNHITNNPEVFQNPRQFMPERFLDSNNNFTKHDHNIVFGIGILIGRSYCFWWETDGNFFAGKRDCLGKSLAQTQFYLFLTGILHQFKFKSPLENLEDVSLKPNYGFTMSTQPFEVIAEERCLGKDW